MCTNEIQEASDKCNSCKVALSCNRLKIEYRHMLEMKSQFMWWRRNTKRCHFLFCFLLGIGSNLEAKFKVLLHGIQLCCEKGYSNVQLESDSLMLVKILNSLTSYLWHPNHLYEEIGKLLHYCISISHCFRQANKLVDILSNVRTKKKEINFMPILLLYLKKFKVLYNLGFTSFRFKILKI